LTSNAEIEFKAEDEVEIEVRSSLRMSNSISTFDLQTLDKGTFIYYVIGFRGFLDQSIPHVNKHKQLAYPSHPPV